MEIGKEAAGVVLDLPHAESGPGILAVLDETGGEGTWKQGVSVSVFFSLLDRSKKDNNKNSESHTLHTPNANPHIAVAHRIRERQPRRAVLALGGLMHMRGRLGRGLVFPAEAREADVVADEIEIGVDAEIVGGLGARQAPREDGVGGAVDDLVRGREDVEGGCEWDDWVCWRAVGGVLAGAGGVFVEVGAGAGGILVEVGAGAGGVLDGGEVLSFAEGGGRDVLQCSEGTEGD